MVSNNKTYPAVPVHSSCYQEQLSKSGYRDPLHRVCGAEKDGDDVVLDGIRLDCRIIL
jgi:hypothetical protein